MYLASLPDCLSFLSRIENPAPANQTPLFSLISGKLLSLINPAQANQAIRQTKEINEKCTSITFTGHCKL